MLIGVSGSGKQTLTKLAAFILENQVFQIKLSKNYTHKDFRASIKQAMLKSGCEAKPTTFLLTDTQIMYESFLEDVNNILNTGEVTNLYDKDDFALMDEPMKKVLRSKGMHEAKENIYDQYVEQLRDHFHIILSMSPVGDLLRNRCRKFPSLVNCCTLNWFFSWPEEALLGVASNYLNRKDITDLSLDEKSKLAGLFPKVHRSVEEAAEKFANELRRKTYVTPKSYLDGISLFIQNLQVVRAQHKFMLARYKNGVDKLQDTNLEIEKLKVLL